LGKAPDHDAPRTIALIISAKEIMTTEATLEVVSPEIKQYQRLKIIAMVAGTVLSLGWLAIVALTLGPVVGQWLAEHLSRSRLVQLLGTAAFLGTTVEILNLPIDFWSSYLVEHRFHLSNQTLGAWIWRRLKGYLVAGILGVLLLSGLYALLWASGSLWWVWATLGWLLVSLVLGQLLPVVILPMFYKVSPLHDEALLDRLRGLTYGTTLNVTGVYRLDLSKDTKKANAALAGLGRTRRVLLGDTLLEQFTPEEIEVVFAHEVGHHVYRHLIKMVALRVPTTLCGLWLVDVLLARIAPALGYSHFTDPAALPLVLLVLTLFGLILSPAQNALSRFFERQCDSYALKRTRNPAAYRSAFIKLAQINKSNPDPHPLIAWLFYDHPPIRERLAMAEDMPSIY
jgi:STE24 endopeptidase